jgi:RNA polymerase sigma-70 factor (ECF subfamily)
MTFYPYEATEETILKRIAAGDQTAVEECITKYGNLIWALAKKYTGTREDAEDAVQEIFTEIWQTAARYDAGKAREITFISTIARRRLIDRLRKTYRRPACQSMEETFETAPNTFESEINTKIEASRAVEAMKALREDQREMMFLNIYEGLSHGEISARTGIPLGTVKTHLRRGFRRVRTMMTRNGGAAENDLALA